MKEKLFKHITGTKLAWHLPSMPFPSPYTSPLTFPYVYKIDNSTLKKYKNLQEIADNIKQLDKHIKNIDYVIKLNK